MNSRNKNVMISILAAVLYYTNILEGTALIKSIIGIIVIFVGCMVFMAWYDDREVFRYGTRIQITQRQFEKHIRGFEKYIENRIEKQKDPEQTKEYILNHISRDKRFAYSGKQMVELINLIEDKTMTSCTRCGREGVKKDMLKTIEGYTCEACLEECVNG